MAPNENEKISVMFVCLGNICRSPMAQAVFQHLVQQRGLEQYFDRIESAGTAGYHIGEEPDERIVAKCRQNNIPIDSLAQAVEARHYVEFDYLIGMDTNNVRNLHSMKPKNSTAQIKLFGEFGDGKPIADPYYSDKNGFETTYQQVLQYSEGLLKHLGFPKSTASL